MSPVEMKIEIDLKLKVNSQKSNGIIFVLIAKADQTPNRLDHQQLASKGFYSCTDD